MAAWGANAQGRSTAEAVQVNRRAVQINRQGGLYGFRSRAAARLERARLAWVGRVALGGRAATGYLATVNGNRATWLSQTTLSLPPAAETSRKPMLS